MVIAVGGGGGSNSCVSGMTPASKRFAGATAELATPLLPSTGGARSMSEASLERLSWQGQRGASLRGWLKLSAPFNPLCALG